MLSLARIKDVMSNPVKRTGVPPPRRVISQDGEGDVYLFIHGIDAAHSATMPNYDIEHAHFSIIIDIAGETHGEIVSGYEIYIGICDWTTPVARFFFPKWTRRIGRRALEVRCLGKAPGLSTVGSYDDHVFTWKQGMDKHACGVYQKMISEANIPNPRAWSSKINCQQFARELVLSLNLVWPIDVPMASGDAVPAMFDKDMLLYSIPKSLTLILKEIDFSRNSMMWRRQKGDLLLVKSAERGDNKQNNLTITNTTNNNKSN